MEWDETLPEDLLQEYKTLVRYGRHPISIQRHSFGWLDENTVAYCLYVFCGASIRTYAAFVYLALKLNMRTVVNFVTAKTRVASLQM